MKLYKYLRVLDISAGFATYQLLLFETKNGFVYSMIHLMAVIFSARECPGKLQEATVPFERRLLRCRSFFLWRNHGKNHGKRPSQWTQPPRKIRMRAYKTFCRSAHANIILHEDSGRNPGNEQTSASPLPPKWTENHPDRR